MVDISYMSSTTHGMVIPTSADGPRFTFNASTANRKQAVWEDGPEILRILEYERSNPDDKTAWAAWKDRHSEETAEEAIQASVAYLRSKEHVGPLDTTQLYQYAASGRDPRKTSAWDFHMPANREPTIAVYEQACQRLEAERVVLAKQAAKEHVITERQDAITRLQEMAPFAQLAFERLDASQEKVSLTYLAAHVVKEILLPACHLLQETHPVAAFNISELHWPFQKMESVHEKLKGLKALSSSGFSSIFLQGPNALAYGLADLKQGLELFAELIANSQPSGLSGTQTLAQPRVPHVAFPIQDTEHYQAPTPLATGHSQQFFPGFTKNLANMFPINAQQAANTNSLPVEEIASAKDSNADKMALLASLFTDTFELDALVESMKQRSREGRGPSTTRCHELTSLFQKVIDGTTAKPWIVTKSEAGNYGEKVVELHEMLKSLDSKQKSIPDTKKLISLVRSVKSALSI